MFWSFRSFGTFNILFLFFVPNFTMPDVLSDPWDFIRFNAQFGFRRKYNYGFANGIFKFAQINVASQFSQKIRDLIRFEFGL
ncbi:hypothetical protein BpHYR1_051858 [Brachionus plicatilis]|uniref:Secreted protein n=1 Tax=Brachionus plicatilis TaxID=10195 RepID=A0A3M7SIE9_BRAPC|nr:hypothetical protein BpHYR1_051858 [Brachionus plicatilis]